MVDNLVETGPALMLDVASGTCGVASQLAERTGACIVGIDLSEAMLRRGHANVVQRRLQERIGLVMGTAERLPFRDHVFDALTFTYLLRYVEDPYSTLRELARVVRPGGMVASLDFHVPEQTLWRKGWWLYTRALLPLAGLLVGGREWFRVGRFLGPSISSHDRRFPLEWTTNAWREAGLVDVKTRTMSLGAGLVMWGTKRDG
jgi:demethylmenaquinone methyltransferase/2-methoxy-6-polyprenyl-1,4-benzoquinol methylase